MEKLLVELQALEAKYDDTIAAQREELLQASVGEGAEGEKKVREAQASLDEKTREKQELEKTLASFVPILDELTNAFIDAEEKLNKAKSTYADKEKAIHAKIENARASAQKLVAGETDPAVLKLNEELKRIIEQGKEKQEKLKKDTEDLEKKNRDWISRTQEERARIIEELNSDLKNQIQAVATLETEIAAVEAEKAQKEKELKKDLEDLESQYSGLEDSNKAAIASAENELKQLTSNLQAEDKALADTIVTLEQQLKEFRDKSTADSAFYRNQLIEINDFYETEVTQLTEKVDKLKKDKVTALVNKKKTEASLQKKIENLSAMTKIQVERFNLELEAIKENNAADLEDHERFKEDILDEINSLKATSEKELGVATNKLAAMRAGIEDILATTREKVELLTREHEEVVASLQEEIRLESEEIAKVQAEIHEVSLTNDSENAKLQRQLVEMENALRAVQSQIASSKREKDLLLASHETSIDTLTKNHANLEKEIEIFCADAELEYSKLDSDFDRTREDISQEQEKIKEKAERKLAEGKAELDRLHSELEEKKQKYDSEISRVEAEKEKVKSEYLQKIRTFTTNIAELNARKQEKLQAMQAKKGSLVQALEELQQQSLLAQEQNITRIAELELALEDVTADGALDHSVLEEEIKMTKDNFMASSQALQQNMLELEREHDHVIYQKQQEIDSMKKKISALETEERMLQEDVQKLKEELETNAELHQSQINSETRDKELALSKLGEEELKTKNLYQQVTEERDDALDCLNEDKERYMREFEDLQAKHEELEQKEMSAQAELVTTAREIAVLNKKISELSSSVSEKTQKASENEKYLHQISKRIEELETFLQESQQKLEYTNKRQSLLKQEKQMAMMDISLLNASKERAEEQQIRAEENRRKAALIEAQREQQEREETMREMCEDLLKEVDKFLTQDIPWSMDAAQALLCYQSLFKEEGARRSFTSKLRDTVEDSTNSSTPGIVSLKPGSYDGLMVLISFCLGKMDLKGNADTFNAQFLVEAAPHFKKLGTNETGLDFIKKNQAWDNMEFWETFFWNTRIAKFQAQFGIVDDSNGYSASQKSFFTNEISHFALELWGWGKEMTVERIMDTVRNLMEVIELEPHEKAYVLNVKEKLEVKRQESLKTSTLASSGAPRRSSSATKLGSGSVSQTGTISDRSKKKKGGFGLFGGKGKKEDEKDKEKEKGSASLPAVTEVALATSIGDCYCLEDYTSNSESNLSWIKGDWIGVFQKNQTGWWKGLNYRTMQSGIFNSSAKTILISLPEGDAEIFQAICDFTSSSKEHLSFTMNTRIVVHEKYVNGYFKGQVDNRIGTFPCNTVRSLTRVVAKAIQANHANGNLNFNEGDEIIVSQRLPTGTWKGYCNGETGIFPGAKVQLLDVSVSEPKASSTKEASEENTEDTVASKRQNLRRALTTDTRANPLQARGTPRSSDAK
eukprot:TRINITY_DN3187_c1_g1_i1.p1 TRINITY_DN3187_c1_g1~~TRINITY_DN3187_c1_g1_i1.p1  ORF type:complete len:1447 (+),score=501.52 TRINITY_DN3187_c1_g1_i1:432-4772(+)